MGAVFTVENTVERERRVREDKRFETDRRRLPEEELDRELEADLWQPVRISVF